MRRFYLNLIVVFLMGISNAKIIYVPQDYSTIQAGIDAATTGDTVLVADSTYYENINFKGKAITVASCFILDRDTLHISKTVINGSQHAHPDSGSVVCFVSGEDTTSVLSGFTITGGTGTYIGQFSMRTGGGIITWNSGAKIIHNNIEYNTIEFNSGLVFGGGVSSGPPGNTNWIVLRDNTIRGNTITGAFGGGGGLALIGHVIITDNMIMHNTAVALQDFIFGGGIFLTVGMPPVINFKRYVLRNTIRYNRALAPNSTGADAGGGGGLAVFSSSLHAIINYNDICYNDVEGNLNVNTDCWGGGVVLQNQTETTIFAENTVAYNKAINNSNCKGAGMAIWHYDQTGSTRIVKNVIAHNVNGTHGGGVYIGGHVNNSAWLINNTICNNSAEHGGAVYIGWINQHVSYPKIENSILWNNGSSLHINTGGVNVMYSNIEGGWSGAGNIDSNPLFTDTLYHLLNPGSPCIDSGNPSYLCNDANGTQNDMGFYGGVTDSLLFHVTGLFEMSPEEVNLQMKYELAQNYPNPFNPKTIISYKLQVVSIIDLSIYNLLGEKIATLVSGKQTAGTYQVEWDAAPAGGQGQAMASGVYLYKLTTDQGFTQTRKLVLLK